MEIQVGSLVRIEKLKFAASVVGGDAHKVECCYYSQKTHAFEIIKVDPFWLSVKEGPCDINPSPGDIFHVIGYVGGVLVDGYPESGNVVCLYDAGGKWEYAYVPVAALRPVKAMVTV